MGKAIIVKQIQPHSVLPLDGITFNDQGHPQSINLTLSTTQAFHQVIAPSFISYHIAPLSGGTAIGAP